MEAFGEEEGVVGLLLGGEDAEEGVVDGVVPLVVRFGRRGEHS